MSVNDYWISELKPYGQKSFYKKAYVYEHKKTGVLYLKSYETFVAMITPDGKFYCDGEYSMTTRKHIYAFNHWYSKPCGESVSNIADLRKAVEQTKLPIELA